ncbi:hypothetical protein [Hyphococcus sp.]|uniref:hypothetical protein n=1 Tax=Hyphococcus sp. TaxID=2038636 RepID=UPI003CCC12B5
MKIRRDIAAHPERSAKQTWEKIVELVTGNDTTDKEQLVGAAGTMQDIIADEHPKDYPIIFSGNGPQLRIYLEYYQDAVERGADIDPIDWNPTAGENWAVDVPADKADIDWLNELFGKRSPRFKAYDKNKGAPSKNEPTSKSASDIAIDWSKVRA